MSGLYLPDQKNVSIIHYDVDEKLCPDPQDRVDINTEEQRGTLQLTSYCRPTVVSSYLIFSYLKFFMSLLFH